MYRTERTKPGCFATRNRTSCTKMLFHNKKILIGITGGIAAYKVCHLIRSIRKQGGRVRTILTKSGEQFMTRTTLEALSEEPVATDIFEASSSNDIHHIDLARWSDCFVIAPATANCLAKSAHGIADDILSTIVLAYSGSILFVPAMHTEMWENKVTQNNVKLLKKLGNEVMSPGTGQLARDRDGIGRMAEPEEIEAAIVKKLGLKNDLAGKKILITLGRTEEPIDPVRYVSNRSSGKMGAALAGEALARGAEVTVVAGAHNVPIPDNATVLSAVTAKEMAKAVKKEITRHDALIMTAAVADFRPVKPSGKKIKKTSVDTLTLELEPTEDILGSLKSVKHKAVVVGFSVETNNEIANSRKKLTGKNLDLVVLNNPLETGAGFEVDTNKVTILRKGRPPKKLPLLSKRETAARIMDTVVELLS